MNGEAIGGFLLLQLVIDRSRQWSKSAPGRFAAVLLHSSQSESAHPRSIRLRSGRCGHSVATINLMTLATALTAADLVQRFSILRR